MPTVRRALPLAAASALLVAIPAASQRQHAPETLVWIDVATHDMAGMPDLGGLGVLGGLAGRMMGQRGPQAYPQARKIPADVGKVLDIAMHNTLRPGVEAEQHVPAGLGVGRSLPLVPPLPGSPSETAPPDEPPGIEVTLHQYWGCGSDVRAGQPKTMTLRVEGGKLDTVGSVAPSLFAPDRDIDTDTRYALWPNPKNTRRIGDRSSMVGQHRITGDGVPASLQFELGQNADFMPKIALTTQGELADSVALSWQPVDRARAYFITAVAMLDQRNFVLWSSSEEAGAGMELVNYLTGNEIDRWLGQKVLLPPSTTRCAIPKGIFKPAAHVTDDGAGMTSLSMIAYGPETNITWPPRPADPKAPWDPEWNVRVRTKSTTVAPLGMDMSGGIDDAGGGEPRQGEETPKKGLLRNLLRSL